MNRARVAEILGRLSGGCIDFAALSGSSHGAITQTDLAAALHAITNQLGQRLIQVKYACMYGDYMALERSTLLLVADIAGTRGWRPRTPGILSGLVTLALSEVIPANRCPSCNGVRYMAATDISPQIICTTCGGSGQRPEITALSRAKWLNVSESLFHRVWRSRLSKIVKEIQEVENVALEQVKKYLSRICE